MFCWFKMASVYFLWMSFKGASISTRSMTTHKLTTWRSWRSHHQNLITFERKLLFLVILWETCSKIMVTYSFIFCLCWCPAFLGRSHFRCCAPSVDSRAKWDINVSPQVVNLPVESDNADVRVESGNGIQISMEVFFVGMRWEQEPWSLYISMKIRINKVESNLCDLAYNYHQYTTMLTYEDGWKNQMYFPNAGLPCWKHKQKVTFNQSNK